MQTGELGTCKTNHNCMVTVDTGFITAETIDNSSKGRLKNYTEPIATKNDPKH